MKGINFAEQLGIEPKPIAPHVMTDTDNMMVVLRMVDTVNKPLVMGVFTDTDAMTEALQDWLGNYFNDHTDGDDDYLPVSLDEYVSEVIDNLVKYGEYYDELFCQTFYKQSAILGVVD